MLLHKVGLKFAQASNMDYYSPNPGGVHVPIRGFIANEEIMRRPGCFCPIRVPVPVPEPATAKVLLHLRDPRDALVSMFYSYCYSHPGEIPGATGYRKEVADLGIDRFVLAMATSEASPVRGDYGTGAHIWDYAGNYARRYKTYVRELLGKPDVTLLRYEDMIEDFAGWLSAFASAFGLSPHDQAYQQIMASEASTIERKKEDKWSHQRKGTPGDHKEKLKAETIDSLNEIFSECMEALGYS
jgi:hypothetical protein